ncbi:MAG: hypothetical protein AAF437_01485 [Pseudomonadota bacterium]
MATLSTLTSAWTCVEQRTAMLGETAFDWGFYDVTILIAVIAIGIAVLEHALTFAIGSTQRSRRRWGLPLINIVAGCGLLAICATPWAHFNVGHPVSDRIYEARSLIAPDYGFTQPSDLMTYPVNSAIWWCNSGACEGDRRDTRSTYHHRHLPFSYRYVVYVECMSPEFNLATMQAIGSDMTGFDGDRRRTARAFFDPEGRFIGPNTKWFTTPLMRSQLSAAERRLSPISFEDAMTRLAEWSDSYYNPEDLPAWTDWETLNDKIQSGTVDSIYRTGGLVIGLHLRDGSQLVGTQTRAGDLERALAACGSQCEDIWFRR